MGGWQILSGILAVLCLGELLYLYRLQKALRELDEAFGARLREPTNTLLGVSCWDRSVRRLAASLNERLTLLTELRHRYEQGDAKLRTAMTNLSHDIRTPLTAICGYLDLLRRQPWVNAAEALSDSAAGQTEGGFGGTAASMDEASPVFISAREARQSARYLAQIEERVAAMKQLTEELLSYLVSASEPKAEAEELSLNAVLEESLAGFYGAFTEKGLIPEVFMPGKPVRRCLNRVALSRVFDNILANALKYSDGRLQIRLTPDGELRFANPSPDLDCVQAGKLFDRFFTVEDGHGSTGLGLSIARLLTEQMGGEITAQYQEGWLVIVLRFEETEGR